MDLTELNIKELNLESCSNEVIESRKSCDEEISNLIPNSHNDFSVSIESEIPEVLYKGMKDFICLNPQWDTYEVMSSALANFLYQNGCSDRAVTEKYLNDLFKISDS